MKPFEAKDYKAFTMFEERWALVTAGVHPSSSLYTRIYGEIRYLYY